MSEDKSMSEAKDEMTAQPCSSGLGQQDEDGEDFSYSSSDWVPSDEETESCDSDAETKAKKKHLEHCKRQYPRPGISPSNIDVTESRNDLNINPEIVKRTQAVVDKIKQTLEMLAALKEDRGFRTISLQSAENGDSPPIAPNLTAYTADNELQGSSSQPNGSLDESKRKKRDNLVLKEPYNKKGFIIKKNTVGGENVKEEWVPIGSGMTLIPREKYKRINWKSYTIATRSLLVAVFPRRVLATHSLTGKPSPAFQDKPAKMTLDQRKTSDVIAEVVDRFKVRENLVSKGISPSNIAITESRNDLNINPEIVKRTQAVVDKIKQTLEMLATLKEDRGFRTISLQSAINGDSTEQTAPIAPNVTAYTADNELPGLSSQPNRSLDESKRKKRDYLVLKKPYDKKDL
ncbi:unnamed protein product [Arctia plantaginis]|uniref:BEN domain-containing protein n=1 Tax=Arctia plantaginis TaxID=874455 RepID=A0A8S0ZBZ5_ARCPL|nr:unnamed protein product [Arctia plantaginis]